MARRPPVDGRPRGRRRGVLGVLLALACVVALALWPARRARRTAPPARWEVAHEEDPGALGPSVPAPVPGARASGSLRARTPSPEPADPPPVIDGVTLEKTEVCAGEENLVTVRAHTTNGTDAFLHSVVDGAMGDAVPVRLWLDDAGRVVGTHTITVFGRTNTPVTVPLPEYQVRDCQPERIATVEPRLRANTWSEFDFTARVFLPPGRGTRPARAARPFAPVAFVWSFGDGDTATTSAPVVTHDYEGRAQDRLYSYFVVGVEARARDGASVRGRTTLPLLNPAFEALARKGIVQLLIALEPRFPEREPDGRVVQHVRLWHTRPGPVTIDGVAATKYFESGAGATSPQAVEVAALLGTTTIPAGREGVRATVVLDPAVDPGVFSVTYRLWGRSAEGYPALGSFSVMRPPRRPTAEDSTPVADPALTAKIQAAREALGKDVVTDEDLWRLEREGAFARLPGPRSGGAGEPAGAPPAGASPAGAPKAGTRSPGAPPSMGGPARALVGPPVPTSVTPPPSATTPGVAAPMPPPEK